MFYVSNIQGTLVPFEPGITPLSVTVPSVSSVPGTAEVLSTTSLDTFTVAIESLLADAPVEAPITPTTTQDAAVYDGPVLLPTAAPTGVADTANIGRAGAVAAYKSNESAGTTKVQKSEMVSQTSSVAPTDRIDDKAGQSHLVDPNKNYRQNSTERKQVVVAADIMSSPVFTLRESDAVEEAQKVFRERKFRHIPIVSANGKLVGILSDRDFMGTLNQKTAGTIKDKMVTNILTANPQTEISAIARVMIDHHIGCLPITDDSGTLVGILTRTDILHAIVNHAPIELWT